MFTTVERGDRLVSVRGRGGVFYLLNQCSCVEPLVSLSSALNGVRVLLEAYEGYERARFLETDLAVREEVRRRTVMLQDHLTRFEDRAREEGHREAASEAKRSKATIIAISEDVQFAISGGPSSSHGNIGRLPRGARKKLVNHDLRSLKMLVTATQAANDLLEAQCAPEVEAKAQFRQQQQFVAHQRDRPATRRRSRLDSTQHAVKRAI